MALTVTAIVLTRPMDEFVAETLELHPAVDALMLVTCQRSVLAFGSRACRKPGA